MASAHKRQATADLAAAYGLQGRDAEVRVLVERVQALGGGSGAAVLVEGPAGIGKTRLVEVALGEATACGWATASATADPLAVHRPFQLARAVAAGLGGDDGIGRELDRLLSQVRERVEPVALVPPGSARVAVIEAIVAELERRASEPLVLAVEDLHHGDDASLAALRATLGLLSELPLLVLLSSRTDDRRHSVAALREDVERLGTVIRPQVLSPAHSVEVAGGLLDAPIGPRLATQVDRAGGNPFLVTELVRVLQAEGRLSEGDGGVDLAEADDHVPAVDVLRLRSLSPRLAEFLRPAAVLGSSFSVRDVAAVAGRPAAWFADAVTEALSSGALVEDGRRLRFAHDMTRDAIYEDIPTPMRAALHEDAARVLAEQGAAPATIATHAALGVAADEAVGWLRRAAADVLSLSPEDALTLLDQALALASSDPSVEAAIQRARVESLMGVGRLEAAASLGIELCERLEDPEERVDLRTRLAGVLVLLNRTDEAVVHLDRAAEETAQPDRRALCQAQGALARMAMADLPGAAALAEIAVTEADASGSLPARTIARSVHGRLPCFTHDYRDGLTSLLAAVDSADADPTGRSHDFTPWFWAGVVGLDLDDHELVDRALREGRARADDGYATWAHPLYCGLAASSHYRRGSLDEAQAEAQTGVSLSLDTGGTQARLWCESLLALVAHLRGERAERDALVKVAEETWERDNALLGIDHFAVAQALAGGDGVRATHLAGAWDLFTDLGLLNCQPVLAVPLVRASVGRDRPRVEMVAAAMADATRRSGLPGLAALDAHVRGLVGDSVDDLVAAAEGFDRLDRRLDRAEAMADGARVAARLGDRRGPGLGRVAVDGFEACEAFGAAGDLAAELGAAGTALRRPVSGWDSLTPTERAVARLVGGGLTNGEIAARRHVSRRTVESHLARVYTKVGYSSRTRLAVEAAGGEGPDRGNR